MTPLDFPFPHPHPHPPRLLFGVVVQPTEVPLALASFLSPSDSLRQLFPSPARTRTHSDTLPSQRSPARAPCAPAALHNATLVQPACRLSIIHACSGARATGAEGVMSSWSPNLTKHKAMLPRDSAPFGAPTIAQVWPIRSTCIKEVTLCQNTSAWLKIEPCIFQRTTAVLTA